MSKLHTHKAKSTGFAVLAVLLLGMGNKTCNLPRNFLRSHRTPIEKTVEHKPAAAPKPHESLVEITPRPKQRTHFRQKPDTVAAARPLIDSVRSVVKIVAEKRPDTSIAEKHTEQHIKIQTIDPQVEIAALQASEDAAEIRLAAAVLLDTTQARLNISANGAVKAPEGSGNNYFNASVQPIMKDQINSAYTTRLLYDSVAASNNKEFVFNNLTITNTTGSKLGIQVVINAPAGWQLITTNIVDINLEPFASSIVPVRLLPSGSNTAQWQQVRIEYRLNNVVDTRKDLFKIKVQEYAGFKASLLNSSRVMTSYEKKISVPVRIKNSGNTPGTYTIGTNNPMLKLESSTSFSMAPGKDTTYYITFPLTEAQYSMLRKEDIRVTVSTDKGETLTFIQSLSKVGNTMWDHTTAYMEMPLQLEAGAQYQGAESPISYYGGLYGSLDIDQNNRLSMALRTNTIAKGQVNDNSIVKFDYTGVHWQASAGNIQGVGEFLLDGYGARLAYNWKARNHAEVFGILKSRTGDNNVIGGASHFELSKDIYLNEGLTVSLDRLAKKNSGIFSQIVEINIPKGKLSLITGVGGEQNNGYITDQTDNTLIGSSLGYNLQWASKHLAFVSNVLYNSNSYPGVFKGQRLQMHDLRYMFKSMFVGGFYEYNFRKQNYFQDSLLFADVFNLKTTNLGLRTGFSAKSTTVVLAAGQQKQLQQGEGAFQVNYTYANLNASTVIAKKLYLNINTFAGVNSSDGGPKDNEVFISSTQGTMQLKAIGASFRYDTGPYYYQEYKNYLLQHEHYEKFIFSPFVELSLLKHSLNVRLQGNYAQTKPGSVTNSNALLNLTYSDQKRGFDFNINGIVPVGGSPGSSYVNTSFRMRLKAPFLPVRKFYNLKLVLFKDVNNNGTRDDNEEPIAGQTLSLNGDLFVSDANGIVQYRNTEKGMYRADFGYSSRLKGWIPNAGTVQEFSLNGNRVIEVPYKMSKILQGKLNVTVDSNSSVPFNPGSIKVTATGADDAIYSTLTDENGEFHFNLPAGNYIVTLSESAFSDNFRPVEYSQTADLVNNDTKIVYYEIKQKKRQLNIRKK